MSNDDIDVSQVRWDDEQGGNTFDEQNEAVPDDVQWDEPEQLYSVSDRLESMGSASVDAPESVAKWKDLSSRAGVSYDVAKAIPDQVEKKLKKPDWQTMVTSAPKTSQYLADNPRDFEIAKDDVEPLQELETFRAELKKRGLPDVTQPQYQESPTAALNREIFSNSDLKNGAIENTANPDGALRFGDSPGEFVDNAGRVASTVTGALGTQFGASLDKISAAYDELTNRMDIVGFDDRQCGLRNQQKTCAAFVRLTQRQKQQRLHLTRTRRAGCLAAFLRLCKPPQPWRWAHSIRCLALRWLASSLVLGSLPMCWSVAVVRKMR